MVRSSRPACDRRLVTRLIVIGQKLAILVEPIFMRKGHRS